MTKKQRRQAQAESTRSQLPAHAPNPEQRTRRHGQFRPCNIRQQELFDALTRSGAGVVFGIGPAGTGKSFVGCHAAMKMYDQGIIDKIVLTRNPMPEGESLGFFKGTEQEKMASWLAPVLGTFKKILRNADGSDGYFNYLMGKGVIELIPMEVLKGSSYDRTMVIVEEGQECPTSVLKMLTTRMGDQSTLFINGDARQSNARGAQGDLDLFLDRIREYDSMIETRAALGEELPGWAKQKTPIVEFSKDDIVRSDVTRKFVEIFY